MSIEKRTWANFPSAKYPYQKRFDISGKRFAWLIVKRFIGRDKRKALVWGCLCDCGKTKNGLGKDLRSGHLTNCGCQTNILIGNATRSHGMRHTKEYSAWMSMKYRCLNKKGLSWARYGGRGIKICSRWTNSFENFFADMGKSPENYSLERIDNNGDYTPGNCKWASKADQIKNRSNSVGVDLQMIARERGIGYKYAWSLHKAGRI